MAGEKISAQGLASDWAEYVRGLRFEQIPAEVIAKTQAVLLHNIAIAFGGVATEQGRRAYAFIEPSDDGVTVIGSPIRAEPDDAALANSVLVRALRMEDVLLPAGTHPGATLIPVALAVGESEEASGSEVLTALIAGYDILGRAAGDLRAVDIVSRSPHHVFGPIATAAVAARLMRLDHDQTAGALSYAGNLATMIYSSFYDFQYGLISRNGVFAAELGRARAPFASDALDGPYGFYAAQLRGQRPSDEELLGEFGTRFDIMKTVLKPHPCTGANLVIYELLHEAIRRHGLTNDNVRRIKVTRSRSFADRGIAGPSYKGPFDAALGGPPDGAFERGKYVATTSVPFALANILLGVEMTEAVFDFPDAPHLLPVMAKIDFEYADLPTWLWTRLEIETTGGRMLRLEGGEDMIGVPDAAAILRTYATPVIGPEKVERLLAAIDTLETAPGLSAIASCLA